MTKYRSVLSGLLTLAIFPSTFLVANAPAQTGQARDEGNSLTEGVGICSDLTIAGDYGWTAEGSLIGTPGLPTTAPFRSVGTAHLDGKGGLTWLERTVVNGTVVNTDFTKAIGTYSINANCTGSAVVNTPYSPVPLNLALVVISRGEQFRSVLTTDAITTVFIRLH